MTKERIERDSMGDVAVPADHAWGAQTQRSLENFPIGRETMPPELLSAFALLKKDFDIPHFLLLSQSSWLPTRK